MPFQFTNSFIRAILDDISDDTTKLKTRWVGLYTAIVGTEGPNITLADLTEADFDGYARQQVGAWTDAYLSGNGLDMIIDGALHFIPDDTVTQNTILGAFLGSASVGGTLIGTDRAPSPIALTGPDTALTYTPAVGLDPNGSFGGGVFTN